MAVGVKAYLARLIEKVDPLPGPAPCGERRTTFAKHHILYQPSTSHQKFEGPALSSRKLPPLFPDNGEQASEIEPQLNSPTALNSSSMEGRGLLGVVL